MAIKRGRFGTFLACTGYPDCKTTRRLVSGTKKARQPDVRLDEKCPTCDAQLLRRAGRFGDFIGCETYPKCKYTRPITLGIKCPKCNDGEFVRRGTSKGRGAGRIFYGCSRIRIVISLRLTSRSPSRARSAVAPFIVEKRTKHGNLRACIRENCDWEIDAPEPVAQPVPEPAPAGPPPMEAQPVGAGSSGEILRGRSSSLDECVLGRVLFAPHLGCAPVGKDSSSGRTTRKIPATHTCRTAQPSQGLAPGTVYRAPTRASLNTARGLVFAGFGVGANASLAKPADSREVFSAASFSFR